MSCGSYWVEWISWPMGRRWPRQRDAKVQLPFVTSCSYTPSQTVNLAWAIRIGFTSDLQDENDWQFDITDVVKLRNTCTEEWGRQIVRCLCVRFVMRDEVAEWLRRWTANPMCSARVGSNPILVELFEREKISVTGNWTRATWVRARYPNH